MQHADLTPAHATSPSRDGGDPVQRVEHAAADAVEGTVAASHERPRRTVALLAVAGGALAAG